MFAAPGLGHVVRLFPADRREYGIVTALSRFASAVMTLMRHPGWHLERR